MRAIHILDEAATEASEAAAWYDRQRPGLGGDFAQAVDAALDLLEGEIIPLTALPGAPGRHGVKRLKLKRFPFDIVLIEQGHELVVIAFAHRSRRPYYWRTRMRG